MKRLISTTAIAMAFGTSAFAGSHSTMFADSAYNADLNLWASDVLGARVYATEDDLDTTMTVTADGTTEWDDIGEVDELLLTRDGEVQAVIIGVGGFLGIGEKDVAVNMSDIQFISDGEDPDEYFLVINANPEAISDAPMFERNDAHEMVNNTANTVDDKIEKLIAPDVEREGYQTAMWGDLNTEDLTGARVYGINDEDVGEISELLLTDDGKLDRAVVDVGGFLGLGEHPVAVKLDELTIIRSEDTGDFRVYIESSEEKLESQPAYDG